jgi:opacity protein-like surface antigen
LIFSKNEKKNQHKFNIVKRLLILLFVVCSHFSYGQDWEAGIWLGGAYYFGDINTEYKFNDPDIGFGVMTRLNLNERLALKLSGNYGQISGYDSKSKEDFQLQRNLHFQSNVFDGTAQFEFNFLKYEHGSKEDNFTPYLFGGISIFSFNPEAEYLGDWVALQPLGTEGQARGFEYDLTEVAFAYGGGIKFDLSYRWSINLEVSARYLSTDYLDDVSTTYPDLTDLQETRSNIAVALSDRSINQSFSEPGRQRGDSSNNDMYMFAGITLAYNFADVKCFTFY